MISGQTKFGIVQNVCALFEKDGENINHENGSYHNCKDVVQNCKILNVMTAGNVLISQLKNREVTAMAIRWIVTDMDGTLLDSEDRISGRTRECLLACQKKGIGLILASGRSYVRLMKYAQLLEMERYGGCLIEINGLALNRLQTKERQVFARLDRQDIERLFPLLESLQVEIQGYEDESLYYWIPEWQRPLKIKEREERGYPADHPLVASAWSWVTTNQNNYPHLKEIRSMQELPESINKLNGTDEPEKIRQVYEALKERFDGKYEIARTCPRLIEIAPAGITKGQTLKRFMKEEGIGEEEVMVFGDGENDVDMFRQVTYSIAMGNAAEYVKEHAWNVTASNDEDGLAKALEKFHVL